MPNLSDEISFWRKLLARFWYVWGLSLCYNGHRMAERALYENGVRAFARAARLWPSYARAYYRSGLIRGRELGQYSAALSDLAQAIALQPDWPDPYLQRGLFHRFNGAPSAAIADLQRYIDLGGEGYWRGEAERQISMLRAEIDEELRPTQSL
ncbi:MAG: hypothetical protein MI924_06955 [Chloroflexales bacterium]|nr:hypothetical protein [Chloroflexales bacterium]